MYQISQVTFICLLLSLQGEVLRAASNDPGFGMGALQNIRKPRSVATIISLLWPQVVGPMRDGHIVEPGFDDVGETPLEVYLRGVRARIQVEKETRQQIRSVVNRHTYKLLPLKFYELELHPLVDQHWEMLPALFPHLYVEPTQVVFGNENPKRNDVH